MRILLATPLYPPDIAPSALYVKELAARLAARHSVSVIAYGHLPEEIKGVTIIPINKSSSRLRRLWRFGHTLGREAKKADVVIIENGPATELPASILSLLTGLQFIFHVTDTKAFLNNKKYSRRRIIRRLAAWRAKRIIVSLESMLPTLPKRAVANFIPHPPERPEILPFADYPEAELADYEKAWARHLKDLTNLLAT